MSSSNSASPSRDDSSSALPASTLGISTNFISPTPTTTPGSIQAQSSTISQQPIPSDCPINTVVIKISTEVVISNYVYYYAPTPIQSFQPTYTGLPDGSLITSPFNQDLLDANFTLLVTGILAMVFARNILVSGDYLRRGRVKKKILFYVLFFSQIISPIAFIPIVCSYFSQRLDCTIVIILSCVTGGISLALLITVILGVKAYKCLNNARFVPIVLSLFQAGAFVVIAFDVIMTRGARRLTGSCIRTDDLRFTRYFVIIQFVESLFICVCFVYVCWKSRGSPAVRGRISIQLSMDELPIEVQSDPLEKEQPVRRGWWDYVPETVAPTSPPEHQPTQRGYWTRLLGPRDPLTSFTITDKQLRSRRRLDRTTIAQENTATSRISNDPLSSSKFARLIPRMELFQEVMRDELLYTTFITSTCVIVAVLAIIGVNFKNGLSVTGWIALNWGIISLLTIHSFGRVVHRHERDALLQHPVTCTAIQQAANDITKRGGRKRQPFDAPPTERSLRIASQGSINAGSIDILIDPFEDPEPVAQKNSVHVSPSSSPDIEAFKSTVTIARRERLQVPNDIYFLRSPSDPDVPTSPLGTPITHTHTVEVLQPQTFVRPSSWSVPPQLTEEFLRDSPSERRSREPVVK